MEVAFGSILVGVHPTVTPMRCILQEQIAWLVQTNRMNNAINVLMETYSAGISTGKQHVLQYSIGWLYYETSARLTPDRKVVFSQQKVWVSQFPLTSIPSEVIGMGKPWNPLTGEMRHIITAPESAPPLGRSRGAGMVTPTRTTLGPPGSSLCRCLAAATPWEQK